jgi:hypothetical protein
METFSPSVLLLPVIIYNFWGTHFRQFNASYHPYFIKNTEKILHKEFKSKSFTKFFRQTAGDSTITVNDFAGI